MRGVNAEHRKERLRALVMLGGIALGGVVGMDMVITGKLDPMTPATWFEAEEPRDWYDRADAIPFAEPYRPYYPTAYTEATQTFETMPIDDEAPPTAELAGAADVRPGGGHEHAIPREAELRAEIERLYATSLETEPRAAPAFGGQHCDDAEGAVHQAGAAGCADDESSELLETACVSETNCLAASVVGVTHASSAAPDKARDDRYGDRGLWAS
jgi:hypothetical protein